MSSGRVLPGMECSKSLLFGNKLTERVAICSPLHARELELNPVAKTFFFSAFIVHETTLKVGWNLKGYWLREFPQEECTD